MRKEFSSHISPIDYDFVFVVAAVVRKCFINRAKALFVAKSYLLHRDGKLILQAAIAGFGVDFRDGKLRKFVSAAPPADIVPLSRVEISRHQLRSRRIIAQ